MSYNPQETAKAGVVLPASPAVRLVGRSTSFTQREWEFPLPQTGSWKVTGAAGTGVSSFVIDTVISRLESGADPSGVLVVAPSKESGARLRRELSTRLDNYAAQSGLVRSVHSLAFALLRQDSEEELRLITGAEQDAVIRELLHGHAADQRGLWPQEVRPALDYVGFARQLRDFLLRAVERGMRPEDLQELGTSFGRPMWNASGDFLLEYQRVQSLAGAHSYSAAELVSEVLRRSHLTDTHPWHTVIVDDAQLLDPTSGELVRKLAASAELAVVAGDTDQAVFAFRGANSEFLQEFPADHRIELTTPRRTPAPACVSIVDTEATMRDVLADAVRRRHLEDGVAWSEIAVIVRSSADIGKVRRTLLAAGVPVHISPTDVVLAEQRLVSATLLALRALQHPLSNAELEGLLTGPVGGADPVTLRRLIRGLRRYAPDRRGIDTLHEVLDGPLPDFQHLLTEREQAILHRVRGVLEAGRAALRSGGTVEEVLWAVWSETQLDARLQAAALRGGATGSQADRDLDSMMALFDAAGDYAERRPGASLESFITHITEQELPTGVRDRRAATPDAVEVLTAHGAVGREWDTVVLTGAQEGTWPSLGETGSLFGQEELVDYLDRDIAPGTPVSHLSARLGEERRLFHVATTRHRRRLLIVAIDQPDGDTVAEPSRFVAEFTGKGVDLAGATARREAGRRLAQARFSQQLGLDVAEPAPVSLRGDNEVDPLEVSVLSVPAFVAQLRRTVVDPEASESDKQQATRQLARMAEAGVPGAHPDEWWAARDIAAESTLKTSGRLSPSRVESLLNCPLNAMLSNLAEEESNPYHLVRGNLAHAYLEALGRGAAVTAAEEMTVKAFAEILDCPDWQRQTLIEEFTDLLHRTRAWVESSKLQLEGAEVPVNVELDGGVSIGGYIDRLVSSDGEYVVVDLKTGKTPVSRDEVKENPQLKTYQLALAHGQFQDGAIRTGQGMPRGGGMLFYPAINKAGGTREQVPIPPEELQEFAEQLPALVDEMKGPRLTARENDKCDDCAIRHICPVQAEGRMTTDV